MPRADQLWWATAIGFFVLFVATTFVAMLDQRLIGGEIVWAKPLKFQISLALHFATLAAIAGWLSAPLRTGNLLFWTAVISMGSAAFEIAYILIQAARQQPSHFNLSTPLFQAMYVLMAIGAVLIVAAAAVVGIVTWYDTGASFGPATRVGIVTGLVGGTLLTLLIAFRMGGALSHHVGTEPANAAHFPITGWSRTVGDLRVPHFFATHMIQSIPLVGLAVDLVLPPWLAVPAAWLSATLWTAFTLWLFRQALAGVPLLPS